MSTLNIPNPLLPDEAPGTLAHLNYYTTPVNNEIPYTRIYESPLPDTNIAYVPRPTVLRDLRPLIDSGKANVTSIDVTGFQVVPKEEGKTVMTEEDFKDEEKIKTVYYDEVIALLKKTTGASKVILWDHTIRKVDPPGVETIDTPENRKPVAYVHIDQTPESGTKRVHRHAGADAERLLRGRAQLINVWRPLRGPVKDSPLAVCDSRSLNQEKDLVPSQLLYKPPLPQGETYQVAHSEGHRWYYLSDMDRDEALLLKCWENVENSTKTPHTGTKDEKYIGQAVLPRHSIEVRALVFHEPEE